MNITSTFPNGIPLVILNKGAGSKPKKISSLRTSPNSSSSFLLAQRKALSRSPLPPIPFPQSLQCSPLILAVSATSVPRSTVPVTSPTPSPAVSGPTPTHRPPSTLTFHLILGHVLCLGCCEKIVSKTSPRLSPACPFCRETFTRENVRVIRIDFNTTRGHDTAKRAPLDAPDILTDIFSRKDDLKLTEPMITSRSREDVRKLELKVARVAAQKSSVEEVSMLYQELKAWLAAETKGETQVR